MSGISKTTSPASSDDAFAGLAAPPTRDDTLTIVWSGHEPWRCGERARLRDEGTEWILGRERDEAPLVFSRYRPSGATGTDPLLGDKLSRKQAVFRRTPRGVTVTNVGNSKLLINGVETKSALLVHGAVLEVKGYYAFLFGEDVSEPTPHVEARRAQRREPNSRWGVGEPHVEARRAQRREPNSRWGVGEPRVDARLFRREHPWGEPCALGIVGESPVAWELREQIAVAAAFNAHALVFGESGSGKELAARGVHTLSARAGGPFVEANIVNLPEGMIAVELFGHVKNHPNPGRPEYIGLIGQAEGGTLFLDEIGAAPLSIQAQLLTVLDKGGVFRRFGDEKTRRANVRVVGATNLRPEELRFDLEPRMPARVVVPSLAERREDLPLIARHLVLQMARETPQLVARFVTKVNGRDEVRFDAALMTALVRLDYPKNVRQLQGILMRVIAQSRGDMLAPNEETQLRASASPPASAAGEAAEIARARAVLDKHGFNKTTAAKELGITRFALTRLVVKAGLQPK